MEKHVYFIRHGQSRENELRVLHDHTAPLTELGRAQAEHVAERVSHLGVEALISSHFIRARETAAIIGAAIGIVPEENELFSEMQSSSHLVGRSYDDPEARAHQETFYASDDPHFREGDRETFVELKERAKACFTLLENHPATRIAAIAHLSFLRVLVGVLMFGEEYERSHLRHLALHLETSNTGITYFRYDDTHARWKLVTWNDQSHLG